MFMINNIFFEDFNLILKNEAIIPRQPHLQLKIIENLHPPITFYPTKLYLY